MAHIRLHTANSSDHHRFPVLNRVAALLLASIASCGIGHAAGGAKAQPAATPAADYGKVPLSFEPNRGQTDPRVQFLSRGEGYGIFLTPAEAVLSLQKPTPKAARLPFDKNAKPTPPPAPISSILRMNLVGANTHATAAAQDQLPGTSNYFLGQNAKQWATDVPTYERVRFASVYPGVDLVYYGNQRQLEYDFVIAPNADTKQIALRFTGASPKIDAGGNLLLSTPSGETSFHKPVVYQLNGDNKISVDASYVVASENVTFALGSYDHSKPLIIDPVLTYATYLGGSLDDRGVAITADASGNAYVVGDTVSTNFPLVNAYQSTNHDTSNGFVVFVTKLNPAGTAAIYSTFLGGVADSHAMAVAVDSAGSAYVTGYTSAGDFPVTSGSFQTICGGNYSNANGSHTRVNGCNPSADTDAFVTKLSPAGNTLAYSSFLGGSNYTQATGIAVDATGRAYVAGNTNANCGPGPYWSVSNGAYPDSWDCLPTTSSAYQTILGGQTLPGSTIWGFFSVVSADGTSLVYSTNFLAPKGTTPSNTALNNQVYGIAIDTSGNAYIVGNAGYGLPTTSNAYYVPPVTTTAALPPYPAFVAKFNPAASGTASLVYSTFLGSSAQTASASNYTNVATGVAVDASGNAYVGGYMNECGYPTTSGAYETASAFTPGGFCNDSFVTKVNPTGTGIVWSTLIGTPVGTTPTNSTINGLTLGSNGNIYVVGTSGGGTYPQVGTLKPGVNGGAVLSELDPTGSKLLFSSYISGYNTDYGIGVATDTNGNMYATGRTYVGGANSIPTTTGALQTSYQGGPYDAFVVKIAPTITSTTTVTIPTGTVTAGQSVALSATVAGPTGTTAIPTGTVTFLSGSTTLGTGTLNGSGIATYTAPSLNATTYNVTASYPGDTNFTASVSIVKSLVVSPATPTVTLTVPSTAVSGASVTMSVAVTGSGATPTGTVTFKDGTTTLSTATLASGAASYSSSSLAVGAHTITVSYAGDSIFAAALSTSQPLTINVPASITFAASPTSLTITHGASGTVTITGTPVGGYSGTASFACGTLPTAATCSFSPTSLTFSGNNTAQSTTLTLSTLTKNAQLEQGPGRNASPGIFLALLLLPLGWARRALRNRKAGWPGVSLLLLIAALSSAAVVGLTGCGSVPGSTTTPAGSYTVTVTVSATGGNSTINLPLTVQ